MGHSDTSSDLLSSIVPWKTREFTPFFFPGERIPLIPLCRVERAPLCGFRGGERFHVNEFIYFKFLRAFTPAKAVEKV